MSQARTTRRGLVILAVMSTNFMVAIEATIVSTAMPQIVGQLGGLNLYAWVFSAFLLTQTASAVVFGKLADVYGRRPVIVAGIVLFLAASLLCGLAWSMPALIVLRFLQGIGAGAMLPVGLTIVGDLYPAAERGKVQGWLASVWAVSAVAGPLAGGLIVQHASWAWVFWVNIPIGVAAVVMFQAYLHETEVRERRPIDRLGAFLFVVAVASLMLALTEGADAPAPVTAAFVALFLASGAAFAWQETRAPDPMISLRVWALRPVAVSNAANFASGAALIGLTTFLPVFVQAVLHRSALVAGFTLTVVVLGWPLGATLSPRLYNRFGLRLLLRLGAALLPAGAAVFVLLGPDSTPVQAAMGSFVMGLGMGMLTTASFIVVQEIVDRSQRGSVTASVIFSRNLGSTLGAALLGAVFNGGLAELGRTRGTPLGSSELRALIESGGSADPAVSAALMTSLHAVFWGGFLMAAIAFGVSLLLPHVEFARPEETRPPR